MKHKIKLSPWIHRPDCWSRFISTALVDHENNGQPVKELINKALEPYYAIYRGDSNETYLEFDNEVDLVAFKLRFGL